MAARCMSIDAWRPSSSQAWENKTQACGGRRAIFAIVSSMPASISASCRNGSSSVPSSICVASGARGAPPGGEGCQRARATKGGGRTERAISCLSARSAQRIACAPSRSGVAARHERKRARAWGVGEEVSPHEQREELGRRNKRQGARVSNSSTSEKNSKTAAEGSSAPRGTCPRASIWSRPTWRRSRAPPSAA